MSFLYHTFFFDPLYNLFILIFTVLPWADAGFAVILLTVLVRLALFPLSQKAIRTQVMMNELSPELAKISEKHKDNAEEKARQTLALYQKHGVNPFSSIFMLFIQLPIIFAIYRIFLHLPEINPEFLYSFIAAPARISTVFLGLIDISGKSLVIALLAAVSSYIQLKIVAKKKDPAEAKSNPLAAAMQNQATFVFPVIMFFIAYRSGVVGLYFLTTNFFSAAQELYVRRKGIRA